ncbi:MAG: hypothetical protein IPL47_14830 [Phyllobacteriaceae bacterium]|nr:hypothetical protein [Phyllobacteriaceae bacterium]
MISPATLAIAKQLRDASAEDERARLTDEQKSAQGRRFSACCRADLRVGHHPLRR